MISVLVTGATTPTGECLVHRLLDGPGVSTVLAVGTEPEPPASLAAAGARLVYRRVDLTRYREVHQLLFGPARELGVEVIVHLAQHRDVRDRGRRVHLQNVEALRSLLELSERHPGIRRIVLKSYAEVYEVSNELPVLVTEEQPLNLSPAAPQYVRDRVEADLLACARLGMAKYDVVVLRCAEALEPGTGSQLYDYLNAPVVLRPAGFDPMINVATSADLVDALRRAVLGDQRGVFNVPGYDTLPLTEGVRKWGAPCIPVPAPLLWPLYEARRWWDGAQFTYPLNSKRLHLGLVLDGTRAREALGYVPRHPLCWPVGGATVPVGPSTLRLDRWPL